MDLPKKFLCWLQLKPTFQWLARPHKGRLGIHTRSSSDTMTPGHNASTPDTGPGWHHWANDQTAGCCHTTCMQYQAAKLLTTSIGHCQESGASADVQHRPANQTCDHSTILPPSGLRPGRSEALLCTFARVAARSIH
jgi:hypothetical protein